jgi:sortase A
MMLAGCILLLSGFWMSGKAALAQILLERSWEQALSGAPKAPWPGMDARPVARLSVPILNESAIVLDQASGQTLAFGPAYMRETAKIGQPGITGIAAHKNTHFEFLQNLKPGYKIKLETVDGKIHSYQVSRAFILDTDSEDFIIPEQAQSAQLALITCYPFDAVSFGGPLRYVVMADLSPSV